LALHVAAVPARPSAGVVPRIGAVACNYDTDIGRKSTCESSRVSKLRANGASHRRTPGLRAAAIEARALGAEGADEREIERAVERAIDAARRIWTLYH